MGESRITPTFEKQQVSGKGKSKLGNTSMRRYSTSLKVVKTSADLSEKRKEGNKVKMPLLPLPLDYELLLESKKKKKGRGTIFGMWYK